MATKKVTQAMIDADPTKFAGINLGDDMPEETVQVPLKTLTEIQEGMLRLERELEDEKGRRVGLEEIMNSQLPASEKQTGLRERKTYEPKFRTVRIRKFPKAGDFTNQDYVVGWTSRGAYQEVDRSGVSPQIVDFIDIIFLSDYVNKEPGKIKAEKVRLLDLLNKGEQVHCKILKTEREDKKQPTGEEIDIHIWDPQHGLVSTGETVDGYFAYSEIKHTIQIPGIIEPITIDAEFCN